MALAAALGKIANKLITQFGQPVTLTVFTEDAYDAATGTATRTPALHSLNAVELARPTKGWQDTVWNEDARWIVPGVVFPFDAVKPGAVIQVGVRRFRVVGPVEPTNLSGSDIIVTVRGKRI